MTNPDPNGLALCRNYLVDAFEQYHGTLSCDELLHMRKLLCLHLYAFTVLQKLCACDVAKGMNIPPTFHAGVFTPLTPLTTFFLSFFMRSIELD